LVWEALRLAEEALNLKRPYKAVLLENVEGFLTSNNGKDIAEVLLQLSALGYGLDVLLLDAAHFVPQSRPRVFVVALLDPQFWLVGEDPFAHPARPRKVRSLVESLREVRWRFLSLPPLPPRKAKGRLEEVLSRPVPEKAWFKGEKLAKELSRIKGKSRERLQQALSKAKATGRPVRLPGYRRVRKEGTVLELRDDGLAGCLRVPTGGSSRQLVVEARPDGSVGVRFMTPQEYAALQGAPEWFWIPGRERQALAGFGDAVAVPVVEWLGWVLRDHLMQGDSRLETVQFGEGSEGAVRL